MPAQAIPARPAQKGKIRRKIHSVWTLITLVIMLSIVSLPTLVVVAVGMAPTTVAMLIDRTERNYGTFAVGGLNLAGIAPFLVGLWFDSGGMAGASAILTNPFALVAMYGAAGAGWLLLLGVPMATGTIDTMNVERRLGRLRARQSDLMDAWGPEVANPNRDRDD